MKHFFIIPIKLYRFFARTLGLGKPFTCVFYPSCSAYALQAFETYPWPKAVWLTLRRIGRCHPWQKNHMDPLR